MTGEDVRVFRTVRRGRPTGTVGTLLQDRSGSKGVPLILPLPHLLSFPPPPLNNDYNTNRL